MSDSLRFYRAKGQNWIMSMSCPEYLHSTNKAFLDEEKRLQVYLDPSSKEELMKIVIDQLVVNNANLFLICQALDVRICSNTTKEMNLS